MRTAYSPASRVTSKSCSRGDRCRGPRGPGCASCRKRSRAARAFSFSWTDFQGASKASASQTESSRSIRTARSAGVRPEATSSARTCTTLPKPCAAVAGASAFTSRPRNHCSAQVLASWSRALPDSATGCVAVAQRDLANGSARTGPTSGSGCAAGTSGWPSSSVSAASRARRSAAASRSASEASGSTVVARSSATSAATARGRRGRPVTSRGSTPSSVRKREGWSPSSAGRLDGGDDQAVAGAGGRDVEEPALLGEQRARGERLGEAVAADAVGLQERAAPAQVGPEPFLDAGDHDQAATPGPWSGGRS